MNVCRQREPHDGEKSSANWLDYYAKNILLPRLTWEISSKQK